MPRVYNILGGIGAGLGAISEGLEERERREQVGARRERLQDLLSKSGDYSQYGEYVDPETGTLDPMALAFMESDMKQKQLEGERAFKKELLGEKLAAQKELYGMRQTAKKSKDYMAEARGARLKKFLTDPLRLEEYKTSKGYDGIEVPFTDTEIMNMLQTGGELPSVDELVRGGRYKKKHRGGFFGLGGEDYLAPVGGGQIPAQMPMPSGGGSEFVDPRVLQTIQESYSR